MEATSQEDLDAALAVADTGGKEVRLFAARLQGHVMAGVAFLSKSLEIIAY